MSERERPLPYGLLAEFATPAAVLRAAQKLREEGYRRWEVYSPYPVHGMDKATGRKNSPVGWFAFGGGVAGCALGMLMVWYMNAFDYRLPVGGKPAFSPFSALPPSFELTILLGAFGTVLGLLVLTGLPRWYHPLLKHRRFKRATHDRFFIVVECADPRFQEAALRRTFEALGGEPIELVED
jgi:hypothetical protein